MVFFNYSTMQMAAKVVYYGPGLCGKTTNLQYIYGHTAADSRGEMVSLETETDRTLFFDLLPLEVGSIGGFNTRIQLYTVPGQVFYNTTRKLVLKGVDGVVFVADSQRPMLQANVESLDNLTENLAEMGLSLEALPVVLQFNKRDLPDICTPEELDAALNRNGWPSYQASAIQGAGIFETLKGISRLTLLSLKKRLAKGPEAASSPRATVPVPRPRVTPPAAAPRPAAAPGARPAGRRSRDVLAELERLRRQAMRSDAAGGKNGREEIHRDIQLTLKPADLARARRFLVNLRVEDGESRVVDAVRDLAVDIDNRASLEKILLRLNIALDAEK